MFSLQAGGMPVGLSAEAQFTTTTFQLAPDDVFVAYTDGITEVENREGELWGQEGLESLLTSCSAEAPEEVIKRILEEVSSFGDGLPQRDDMTLLVMRVQEGCEV